MSKSVKKCTSRQPWSFDISHCSFFSHYGLGISHSLLTLALLLANLSRLAAAETMPQEGLLLRLDAAEQIAARQKAQLPPLLDSRPVDRLLNTGNNPLAGVQPLASARPIFRFGGGEAFIRFDGKDDFISISQPHRVAAAVTIFVLAAPRSNPGNFSALFSSAEAARNDYTSGLNLDFGPASTRELSVLNVEGAGSSGVYNFLQPGRNLAAKLPFTGFHVFTLRSSVGDKGNELFLDGIRLGERKRTESTIGLDEIVIGGRLYSNDPAQLPFAQGFFHGEIATVLVYERALENHEREQVEQWLFARIPALNALASGSSGHALESLSNPPLVQMLVPGFTVQELPFKIKNLNNIRYRHDGKLVALGYDGRLYLLTDTDGDGLEDKAEVFWDQEPLRAPIGLALLPKDDPRGDGALVASKNRVSLLVDTNRDGRADREIVVASGWKETFHNVDTLGVALDPKDGSVWFSLGCENFADAYLHDAATGKTKYRLESERGTIQRVSADFSKRETICTGIRFACALAFNREGDLFATDQEGATWLPNGNPLDELLHIVPGRHYGFPPRHPKNLPQVIDEPPVMEYGPQHQSTVGMVFNESVNGGPTFGPTFWRHDALICGESRGKLYRTKLVKTADGYVAQNQLIACLGMLTVDACVTPVGDLLIACHSGPPDWGTGPAGEGKLFKVHYARPDLPQVVSAWASAPDEFRIAFDRPLKPEDWAGAREKTRVEAGLYVSPGDRYEVIRPGYQVVRDQMASPRRWVDVQSLSLSADLRTLVLHVPRQTEPVNYAVTLPVPAAWLAKPVQRFNDSTIQRLITQNPTLDIAISLHGLDAILKNDTETSRVTLPHPSFSVAREFTAGSAEHEQFFQRMEKAGSVAQLTLRANLDVSNIFVPATQPGSTLDWDIAADPFANRTMSVRQDFSTSSPREIVLPAAEGRTKPLNLAFNGSVNTTGSGLTFALDQQTRPIPLNRFRLPWAATAATNISLTASSVRTDVKGNWLQGRRLFSGQAGCITCHTLRGEGTAFGPDLSNLIYRDRDSILQDILKPSATINPDHTGSTVTLKDGTELNGIVQSLTGEKIVIRQAAGVEVHRPRVEVASIEPMKLSLMPDNFGQLFSPAQLEDLLTFLLTNPLEPAAIARLEPPTPTPRTRAELAPFLPPITAASENPAPLHLLLSSGAKDHGVDEHDYPLWLERWSRLLALAPNVTIAQCSGFPSREQLARADVTVFYSANSGWDTKAAALLDEYQQRGGGLVYLHWGIEGGKEPAALAERAGLAFSASAFRHGDMDLIFTDTSNPITQGFTHLHLTDESYWALRGDPARISVLATSTEDKQPRPQLWTFQHYKGRVFGCIPGHYTWTFDDPLYRVLVLRGIAWAAGLTDINRLVEVAPVGARLAP